MSCEELQEQYGAYALGTLDRAESGELREHLETNCPNCLPGVRKAMGVVTLLSGGVELKDPPKRLRKRVLALVNPAAVQDNAWQLGWSLAVLFAMVLLVIAIPAKKQSEDTARLEQALSVLNDPTAKDVSFGNAEKPARGRVFVSATKGVVIIAANLPRIDKGKAFELWTIPANGKPVPQGTFQAAPDATAVYVRQGAMEQPIAVAVSVEPEGGSLQPTTTPFIVSKMGS